MSARRQKDQPTSPSRHASDDLGDNANKIIKEVKIKSEGGKKERLPENKTPIYPASTVPEETTADISRRNRGLPKEDDVETLYSEVLKEGKLENKDVKKKQQDTCDYCGSPMPDSSKVDFYLCPCGHQSIC